MVFTTVSGGSQGDGTTGCIFRGTEWRKIAAIPNFPKTYKKPGQPRHRIGSVPNMGLGMFATRDLKAGDVILAERPIAVIPRKLGLLAASGQGSDLYPEKVRAEWNKQLQMLVDRMSPDNRKAFNELTNVLPEQGMLGVFGTNSFGLSEIMGDENDDENTYIALCKDGARVNHRSAPIFKWHTSMTQGLVVQQL